MKSWMAGVILMTVIAAPVLALEADFDGDPRVSINEGPLTTHFIDLSTGEVIRWSWTFGDGATSAEQEPTHEYTTPGVYSVKLCVTGKFGAQDCTTKTQFIYVGPMASFDTSPRSGPAPLTVAFTNTSILGSFAWATSTWQFSDGWMTIEQHPTHVFQAPGRYWVMLIVQDPITGIFGSAFDIVYAKGGVIAPR